MYVNTYIHTHVGANAPSELESWIWWKEEAISVKLTNPANTTRGLQGAASARRGSSGKVCYRLLQDAGHTSQAP